MEPLQTVLFLGGGLVLWATLFMTALYFAGRIDRDGRRLLARSLVWATFLSPGIAVAGHGVLPAPPIVVMILPGNLFSGLAQVAVYFCIYSFIGWLVSAVRGMNDRGHLP